MANFSIDMAIKVIPNFNGDPLKLHQFLSCCEVVYKPIGREADRQLFISLLKSKITDRAYDETFKFKEFTSWKELKRDLKALFSTTRPFELIQVELIKTKQKRDEDVKTFSNRIHELLSELDDACINSEGAEAASHIKILNQKTALKVFQDGLLEPIRLLIKACRYTRFQDAIVRAIEEEKLQKEKVFTSGNPSFSKPVKCHNCNRPGHMAANCLSRTNGPIHRNIQSNFPPSSSSNFPPSSSSIFPSSVNNSHRPFNTTNNRSVNYSVIICNYCKFPGHNISQCRKKKYNDSRREAQEGGQQFQPIAVAGPSNKSGNEERLVSMPSQNKPMRVNQL